MVYMCISMQIMEFFCELTRGSGGIARKVQETRYGMFPSDTCT